MTRKVADCRDFPGSNCTLTIAGEEAEVLRAAVDHAVSVHGEKRSPELEKEVLKTLKDEVPAPRITGAPPAKDLPTSH